MKWVLAEEEEGGLSTESFCLMSGKRRRECSLDSPPSTEAVLKHPKFEDDEYEENVIGRIPDEILAAIFCFITSGSDWFSILQVNQRFLRVARRAFDPSMNENNAIRWAARHGKLEAVLALLRDDRVDPSQVELSPTGHPFFALRIVYFLKDDKIDPIPHRIPLPSLLFSRIDFRTSN